MLRVCFAMAGTDTRLRQVGLHRQLQKRIPQRDSVQDGACRRGETALSALRHPLRVPFGWGSLPPMPFARAARAVPPCCSATRRAPSRIAFNHIVRARAHCGARG